MTAWLNHSVIVFCKVTSVLLSKHGELARLTFSVWGQHMEKFTFTCSISVFNHTVQF